MGNHTSSFWPSLGFLKKRKKQKGSKKKYENNSRRSVPTAAPMYDTVANVPVYAVVDKGDKSRKPVDDSVQYADIEIVRNPQKSQKKKSVPTAVPMYDTVANVPVYAVVDKGNKSRKPVDDRVQYADIEILRKPQKSQKKKVPFIQNQETTEYATINVPVQYNSVKGTLV